MKTEYAVYEHLKHLGVSASLKGYKYLQLAVSLVLAEPETMEAVTKALYPRVAQMCDSTTSRVERAIRHAIEYVFGNTDYDVLKKYFGNTVSIRAGKLTNAQFIAGLAEHIKMEVLKND